MDFHVFAQQNVMSFDRADLELSLSTEDRGNIFRISPSGKDYSSMMELPDNIIRSNAVATLTLRATFGEVQEFATMSGGYAKERSHNTEASVRVPIGLLLAINIVQNRANYVQAFVEHREWPSVNASDQCVVICPKTGKSLTGRNVCIECECSRGIVKICC